MPPYSRDVWNVADVRRFIAERTVENQHLEFKAIQAIGLLSVHSNVSVDKRRAEMSCDLSSFANADGGTIVYGIKECDHVASEIRGADNTSPADRDQLFQVANALIQPPIAGLQIAVVDTESENRMREQLFVFDVPRDESVAHQATDKRYYRRFGTQKVQLDHTGVLDLFRRSEAPALRVWLEPTDRKGLPAEFLARSDIVVQGVALLIENTSAAVCMHAIIDIFVDDRIDFLGVPGAWDSHARRVGDVILNDNRHRVSFKLFQRKWNGNSGDMVPLFKGSQYYLADQVCGIGFHPRLIGVPHFIKWRCRAPHMDETRGTIAFWMHDSDLVVQYTDWQVWDVRS